MTSLQGAQLLRKILDSRLLDVHTALPCQVKAWDAAAQTVDVQPMVKNVIFGETAELEESYPIIYNVPVIYPRCGAYMVAFPLAVDDFVTVLFNEWSIDNYLEQGKEVHPVDAQRHAFSGAVAFPGGPFPAADPIAETVDSLLVGYAGGTFLKIPSGGVAEIGTIAGVKEFIAQAQKVLTELQAIQTDQIALKALLVSHVHPGVTVGAGATAVSPAFAAHTPHTPGSVAATKAKVE